MGNKQWELKIKCGNVNVVYGEQRIINLKKMGKSEYGLCETKKNKSRERRAERWTGIMEERV
jgi:hypothetical protein